MLFKRPLSTKLLFTMFILSIIGGIIGGISIYLDKVKLHNALICEFNSFEDVILLESEKSSDIFAYLQYCENENRDFFFKWSPINDDVDEVYLIDSIYEGKILKIKFFGKIYKTSSRQEWIEGYVHKKYLKNCSLPR